jgi:hypothetical protein
VAGCCEHGNETSASIKDGGFLDSVSRGNLLHGVIRLQFHELLVSRVDNLVVVYCCFLGRLRWFYTLPADLFPVLHTLFALKLHSLPFHGAFSRRIHPLLRKANTMISSLWREGSE